jgi:hypothetical protein
MHAVFLVDGMIAELLNGMNKQFLIGQAKHVRLENIFTTPQVVHTRGRFILREPSSLAQCF